MNKNGDNKEYKFADTNLYRNLEALIRQVGKWHPNRAKIKYDSQTLLHLCWNHPEAMNRLIIRHGWLGLNFVHPYEMDKLEIIKRFIQERERWYTLEGRLGSEKQSDQLSLF